MDKVELAKRLASAVHYGQFDKGGAERIYHVLHVGQQFPAESPHRIVGYLHDALEDSLLLDQNGIYHVFGVEIHNAIMTITRMRGETYFRYIDRVKLNDIALLVKIEDLKHNMDRARWPGMTDSYYERELKALKILEEERQRRMVENP